MDAESGDYEKWIMTKWISKLITKMKWWISKRAICDFQWGYGWWLRKGVKRWAGVENEVKLLVFLGVTDMIAKLIYGAYACPYDFSPF